MRLENTSTLHPRCYSHAGLSAEVSKSRYSLTLSFFHGGGFGNGLSHSRDSGRASYPPVRHQHQLC
jgi:hypothetical protein